MGNTTLQRRTYTRLGFIDDELNINTSKEVDALIGDQTTEVINLALTRLIQSIDLVAPLAVDDTTATISSGVTPTVGNVLCLKEGVQFYQGRILSVVANGLDWDVLLDTPLDAAFTIAGGCSERTDNLAVNGAITPVEFAVSPANLSSGVTWDITRVIGSIVGDQSMDDSKFGSITNGLTNGLVFRYSDGYSKNIFNVKTNGELAAQMYDVAYASNTPQGEWGLRFRRSFAGQDKSGVAIRLSAVAQDQLVVIVQDDLSSLLDFRIIAHGHRTDDPIIT